MADPSGHHGFQYEVMVIHDLDELRVPMLDGLAKVWNGKSKNRIDDLDGTPHV